MVVEGEQDSQAAPMIDPFGRFVSYLRVSVTDRCDFRCRYCMPEKMTFLPSKDLLTLDELRRLCFAFIQKGVRRIRLTGGEPLVRKDIMVLVRELGSKIGNGLDEVTMTTNGSQLSRYANELYECGVRRINVSLDTLDPEKFRRITRWGDFDKVMRGIEAAQDAGLSVKLNVVALKNDNEDEIPDMLRYAHARNMDLTVIETMPMGDVDDDRTSQYLPLSKLRADLEKQFTLTEIAHKTGGPARYFRVSETAGRLGFITPMTHNFCESCNRVRLSCAGKLFMCLGQNDAADLRKSLRSSLDDITLNSAIDDAILRKPRGHDFIIDRSHNRSIIARHMSATGG
ncbi:GTP 3',8-cyclase MoaA [Rhizobium tubonense]|uniref:GTP 3',8-cyclase n=1 Tax=Rhizobium tubonense TaxID=484088 RepID=A0A2W4CRG6_9HYPH|nr:GTP 3',8-cyclase MoaA [Rhizobium tubonense]PZM08024.1 GTP 3',8-cyclase MoaA [Rhizobium tubonense]